jgi:hypothetical protein
MGSPETRTGSLTGVDAGRPGCELGPPAPRREAGGVDPATTESAGTVVADVCVFDVVWVVAVVPVVVVVDAGRVIGLPMAGEAAGTSADEAGLATNSDSATASSVPAAQA